MSVTEFRLRLTLPVNIRDLEYIFGDSTERRGCGLTPIIAVRDHAGYLNRCKSYTADSPLSKTNGGRNEDIS